MLVAVDLLQIAQHAEKVVEEPRRAFRICRVRRQNVEKKQTKQTDSSFLFRSLASLTGVNSVFFVKAGHHLNNYSDEISSFPKEGNKKTQFNNQVQMINTDATTKSRVKDFLSRQKKKRKVFKRREIKRRVSPTVEVFGEAVDGREVVAWRAADQQVDGHHGLESAGANNNMTIHFIHSCCFSSSFKVVRIAREPFLFGVSAVHRVDAPPFPTRS